LLLLLLLLYDDGGDDDDDNDEFIPVFKDGNDPETHLMMSQLKKSESKRENIITIRGYHIRYILYHSDIAHVSSLQISLKNLYDRSEFS
jgi:hypothetical protein